MSLQKQEIVLWLDTLSDDALVGVDDGGLALRDEGSNAYLEIGGLSNSKDPDYFEIEFEDEQVFRRAADSVWTPTIGDRIMLVRANRLEDVKLSLASMLGLEEDVDYCISASSITEDDMG